MNHKVELNSNNLHISNSVITFCQLNSFSGNSNVYTVLLNVEGVLSPNGTRQIPFTVLVRYNVSYSSNTNGELVQSWECLGLESVGRLGKDKLFRVDKTAEEYLLGSHYFAEQSIKKLSVLLYKSIAYLLAR